MTMRACAWMSSGYLIAVCATAILCAAVCPCVADAVGDLKQGQDLVRKGDCENAIRILSSVVPADPSLAPQAIQSMAECYKRQKAWSRAIDCYAELLAKYAGKVAADSEVRTWIMDCYLADGQIEKALSLKRELIDDCGSDAWKVHYTVGRRYVWQHRYAQAIPELEKALALGETRREDPARRDAGTRLLNCYIVEQRWQNAESLLNKLMTEYPDDKRQWHFALGQCYQANAKLDQAIQEFRMALDLASIKKGDLRGRDIGKALFECYLTLGDLESALPLVEALQSSFPAEAASWQLQLGRIYRSRNELDKALPYFRSVVDSSKKRWEIRSAQIYLGESLFLQGKGDEALAAIKTYYEKRPTLLDEHLLVHGAVLYHGAKDYSRSSATLRQLISDCPNSPLKPTAQELLVAALEQLGQWNEAASVLEEMASGLKNKGLLKHQIGDAYFHAGRHIQAIKAYRDATKDTTLDSETRADAMYHMALCYQDMGLPNAARRLAEQVSTRYPDTSAARHARGALLLSSGGDVDKTVN